MNIDMFVILWTYLTAISLIDIDITIELAWSDCFHRYS